uniref:Uncharacterized protein n=1 Tax=Rousettus aegyptiacus TaxID=9407 RepID=A0A7J8DYN0_ROUAE|nr:hypothetical protein HJG63_008445 [Rousettus aegyptiacus]
MSTAHPFQRVKILKHEIPLSRVCSGLRPRPGSPPLLGRGWGWGGSQLYPRGERGRLAARTPPEGPWRAQVTRPRERALRLEPHFAGLGCLGVGSASAGRGREPPPPRVPGPRRAGALQYGAAPCAPAPPPRAPPSGCASTDAEQEEYGGMTWKHLTFPQRKWRRKAGPISQEGPCDVRRDLFPQPPGERVPDSPPGERPSPAHPGSCGRQDPKQTFSSGPFPIANDKWESQKKKASRGGSLKKKKQS